jgi:ribose transport system substrate-binding protein
MKKIGFALLVAVMVLACRSKVEKPEIVVMVMTSAHPYFQAVIAEWQHLAEQNGFTVSIMDPNFDTAKQMKIVEDLITRRPAGVAFAPLDSRIAVKMLQKIVAADIPVIAYNINPAEKIVPTVVGEDFQGGQMAGEAAAKEWLQSHPGRVPKIGIVGQVGILEVDKREQGFLAGVQKVIPDAVVTQKVNGYGVRDKALRAAEDMLQAHQDLDIAFGINDDSALAIVDAVQEINMKNILIAGIGGSEPVVKELVKPGSPLKIVAANPPKDIADISYELLKKVMQGNKEYKLEYLPFHKIEPDHAMEWLQVQFPTNTKPEKI